MNWFWGTVDRYVTSFQEMYDTDQPWVGYGYFVPTWLEKILGRFSVRCHCFICGEKKYPTVRIPRWGPIEDPALAHPARTRFLEEHVHPGVNQHPMSWELPLRNPAALGDGDLGELMELVRDRTHRDLKDVPGGLKEDQR